MDNTGTGFSDNAFTDVDTAPKSPVGKKENLYRSEYSSDLGAGKFSSSGISTDLLGGDREDDDDMYGTGSFSMQTGTKKNKQSTQKGGKKKDASK